MKPPAARVPAKMASVFATVAALALSAPGRARAFPDDPGARAIGMGGAGRADARADEGPRLNPSGMSLARVYTVEGDYQLISKDGGQFVHAAVVDSTSASKVALGLFYSYVTAPTMGAVPRLGGHEAGLALSYPLGELLLVGASVKYLYLSGGAEPDGGTRHTGVTADAGVTLRALPILTFGLAGYNLHDLSTREAPVALGYGAALTPLPDLMIVLDGLEDFTTSDPSHGVQTTVAAGAEYLINRRAVPRLGGGRDGRSGDGYLSAGLTALSELGAVDVAVRQDISGARKVTYVVAGLRLFVPAP